MFLKQLRWILSWLYLFLSNSQNLQIETRPDWISPLSFLFFGLLAIYITEFQYVPEKYQVSASKIRKQTNQRTLYIADSLFSSKRGLLKICTNVRYSLTMVNSSGEYVHIFLLFLEMAWPDLWVGSTRIHVTLHLRGQRFRMFWKKLF